MESLERVLIGSAVLHGFSPSTGCDAETRVFDKDPIKIIDTLGDTINSSEFVFISVPTPSKVDGSIDLSILESAMSEISELSENKNTIF